MSTLPTALEYARKASTYSKEYPVFDMRALFTTLTGRQNLDMVSQVGVGNNNDLKNREYVYRIVSYSLKWLQVGEDRATRHVFKSTDECYEFLVGSEYFLVDELYACYEDLILEQREVAQTKYGILPTTKSKEKMLRAEIEELRLLRGNTSVIEEDEKVDDDQQ